MNDENYNGVVTIPLGQLFSLCSPTNTGSVKWGHPVPLDVPGIYIISTTPDETDGTGPFLEYEPDFAALSELRQLCPDIRVDGHVADDAEVAGRLSNLWVPGAAVLYIGLASTSLQTRVGAYYTSKLGKPSPHSGGWWLKTFRHLHDCHVHYAVCSDVEKQEHSMINAFSKSLSAKQKSAMFDSERLAPFANVEVSRRIYKRHGLSNYKVPRSNLSDQIDAPGTQKKPSIIREASDDVPGVSSELGHALVSDHATVLSQILTEKDRNRSYLRIPSEEKHKFPETAAKVLLNLKGQTEWANWNPNGSRSGRLSINVRIMRQIVVVGQRLQLGVSSNGYSIP